jgi:hypothetical protein
MLRLANLYWTEVEALFKHALSTLHTSLVFMLSYYRYKPIVSVN